MGTSMNTKVIKMKTITPMCSHGAEKEAELRLTEVKHAMRFWWRTINYYSDCDKLKQKERALFGGLTNKSPLLLKPELDKELHNVEITMKVRKLPKIKAIESQTIKFGMMSDKHIDQYINMLELTSYLGGIGQRSREGYGAFKILNQKTKITNRNELLQRIKALINETGNQSIKDSYGNNNYDINIDVPLGAKYPMVKKIIIGNEINQKEQVTSIFLDEVASLVKKVNPIGELEPYIYISCYELEKGNIIPILTQLTYPKKVGLKKYLDYCQEYISGFRSL